MKLAEDVNVLSFLNTERLRNSVFNVRAAAPAIAMTNNVCAAVEQRFVIKVLVKEKLKLVQI